MINVFAAVSDVILGSADLIIGDNQRKILLIVELTFHYYQVHILTVILRFVILQSVRFVFALEDVDYEGLRSAKRGVIPFKSSHVLQKMKFATFKDENPEIATRLEDPNGYRRRQQNKG